MLLSTNITFTKGKWKCLSLSPQKELGSLSLIKFGESSVVKGLVMSLNLISGQQDTNKTGQ